MELDSVHGGYSDVRLWPLYLLTSGLTLFLAPLVGLLLASVAVFTPALLIVIRIAQKQNAPATPAIQISQPTETEQLITELQPSYS